MEWVICNRVRVQYGTGIGFGYCKSGIGRFGGFGLRFMCYYCVHVNKDYRLKIL